MTERQRVDDEMTERQRVDDEMTERQRVDDEQLPGGRIDELPAEIPTAPAVSSPTSVEDQSPLPRDEQRADAANVRVLFWIAAITLATVLFIGLLLFLNWIL
jgi:hypothetical protein